VLDHESVEDADITAAGVAVRRFLAPRVRDRAVVEDLTQESLLKVLEARHRLSRDALVPYAVTVAKNLVVGRARSTAVAERHLHRLAGDGVSPEPDELVLRKEDRKALRLALDALPDSDRALLLAHVVEGDDTASLAAAHGGTAGGVAARLSRARARARVDYLVASRRAVLPTSHCRPVLLALSAADRRRQVAVRAADHVLACPACGDLAPALVERRRFLISLFPIAVLARLLGASRAAIGAHPVASVGMALGATVGSVALIAGTGAHPRHDQTVTTTAPPPPVTTVARARPTLPPRPAGAVDVRTLLPLSPAELGHFTGRQVVAKATPVLSVPADEGFWIGYGDDRRIWVQLATTGESAAQIKAGQHVLFRGRLSAHGVAFSSRVGVGPSQGGGRLTAMGAHIEVDPAKMILSKYSISASHTWPDPCSCYKH